MIRHGFAFVFVLVVSGAAAQAQVINFENPSPPLAAESFYNGSDGAGGFQTGGVKFNNDYQDFGGGFYSWGGWSYSNQTTTVASADLSQPDYNYQYSAAAGKGSRDSSTYAVGYVDPYVPTTPTITLPAGEHPLSIRVTNTTYDAISMTYGDEFSKQFSGPTASSAGDWFKLTITGLDASNQPMGAVDFYLADLRAGSTTGIVNTWQNVNLFSLYNAHSLAFTLSSSDNGSFGMNTPAYFAADDLSLTALPGDVVHDGIVNAADISAIASNWLSNNPAADANGDGIVNAADLSMVASNWLASVPSSSSAVAVPEPAAGLLALLGLASLFVAAKLRR